MLDATATDRPPTRLHPLELERHRPELLRQARRWLRCGAEDAVHATLMAVVNAPDTFGSPSALRAGLIGLLERRIVDVLRHPTRLPTPARGLGVTKN